MKIINTPNGNKIELYSTAKEMPTMRYNELQKYQLFQSGIGSDFSDVTDRFSRWFSFQQAGQYAEALKEGENLYYTHYAIMEGANFAVFSFACFISSFDDVPYTDLSDDGIKKMVEIVNKSGISQDEVEIFVDEVKKK